MKKKVQQAIVAARAGELVQAQALLADVLEHDQEDIQAWFLLGNLVDSEPQRSAYLQKVRELDPTYEPLLEQSDKEDELVVAEVVEPQTTEVLDDKLDLADEDDLLLAALMDNGSEEMTFSAEAFLADEADVIEEMDTAVSQTQPIADVPTKEMAQLPQTVELDAADAPTQIAPALADAPTVEAKAIEPSQTRAATVKKTTVDKPKSKKGEPAPLTGILYLLIALTVITFLALLYFLLF